MEKNFKYIILIVVIIIIGIIISLLILMQNNLETEENTISLDSNIVVPIQENVEEETDMSTYLFAKDLAEILFKYVNAEEEYINYPEALVSILDDEYLNKNNLSEGNILTFFENYKNINSYSIKEIYTYNSNATSNKILYTKGIVRKDGSEENIYMAIKEDITNNAYSLSIITEEEFNEVKSSKILQEEPDINIESNNYNTMYTKNVSDYQICKSFFDDYINTLINNVTYGYDLLNSEYSSAKFESEDEYVEYIGNTENLTSLIMMQYSITETNEYIQYLAVDQEENYYIFRVTMGMDYTVILDTYTIDIPEFTDKYNSATYQEQVILNINKINLALNDGDYKYIYRVMADSFKANYFADYETFEAYMKETFFEDNEFDYVTFDTASGYYTYTVNITDGSGNSSDTITKTFIMALGDGTEFEFSFNVE